MAENSNNNTDKGFDTNNSASYTDNYSEFNNIFKPKLPNSGVVLTLGILSIVTLCCCGPFLSIILSIIALSLSLKISKELESNKSVYKQSSINNFKAGKICSIIGLCIGIIFLFYLIIVFLGDFSWSISDELNKTWNEISY